MTENAQGKVEALPDLDDLLQCPVCYEIPAGQIFQCNEGHHVCGRCKMRLDVCPVCRAFFFGTRNYAMEELIANVRKLQAFKLGGKVTTGSPPTEAKLEDKASSSEEHRSLHEDDFENDSETAPRPPSSCKGLFRCLCCKNNPERLPSARLLNHLRYYHSADLIEGRSENGGYIQAWQFPTIPGRIVTAVRVADMGVFFLVIEITDDSVLAWMQMAASAWVSNEHYYTFTLSGNDREAIFSDCAWSVRQCEGSLKKRGRCLAVRGADARALLRPSAMSGRVVVRRARPDLMPHAAPRAVLRVASRSRPPHTLEPFLQDIQHDVERLSRAFAAIGQEADSLVRSEAQMTARLNHLRRLEALREAVESRATPDAAAAAAVVAAAADAATPTPAPTAAAAPRAPPPPPAQMSRSQARRMRQRLRAALRAEEGPAAAGRSDARPTANNAVVAAPAQLNGRPAADLTASGRCSSGVPQRGTDQQTNRNSNTRSSNQSPNAQNQNVNSPVRANCGLILVAAPRPNSGVTLTAAPRNNSDATVTAAPRSTSGVTLTAAPRNTSGVTLTAAARPNSGATVTAAPRPNSGATVTAAPRPNSGATVTAAPRPNSGATVTAAPRPNSGATVTAAARPNSGATVTAAPRPNSGATVTAAARPNSGATVTAAPRTGSGATLSAAAAPSPPVPASGPSEPSAPPPQQPATNGTSSRNKKKRRQRR